MSVLLVMAFGFLGFGPLEPVQHHSLNVNDWRITTRFDRFTGQVTCSAHKPGIQLEGGVVTFFLGKNVDTTQALYRLDFGRAYRASTISSDNVTFGRPINLVSLNNPSDGQLGLPVERLKSVNRVDIRPKPGVASRAYIVSDLDQVLNAEVKLGCPTQSIAH